ncbi:MAG: HAMP domain-containing histidine kinase [Phycisphaeraceae bacterium]|nr:HAMP domain-containing histidine kinase [Phycisphaeraceae bacterium]MCW5762828.1 HAMP domain-containing histidine kinase [Phycisphaeraceae bacterium]
MLRPLLLRLSLSNKCLLLFGGAITILIAIALTVPWLRMNGLVRAGQLEISRELAQVWIELDQPEALLVAGASITETPADEASFNDFLTRAARAFTRPKPRNELLESTWEGGSKRYRYARARRDEAGTLVSIVSIEQRSDGAAANLAINTLYLLAAGLVVLGVAVLLFRAILTRIILSPVRSLRESAERVRDGDLATRSEIRTGDEFETLAETFNLMLSDLEMKQDQLRAINSALDGRLTELTEVNAALAKATQLKSEFVASVSHELRTPMNSILGFAELLAEIARAEHERFVTDSQSIPVALTKRQRYLDNIISAGRTLLEMIESLLEMAKLEAGRIEVNPAPMSVGATCESLVALIDPLARRKGLEVQLDVRSDVPIIETDIKKFSQIVFNLLSNAVKFTDSPEGKRGLIILRAERLAPTGLLSQDARVRVSVIDNGPGISADDQKLLFEKFSRLDRDGTRPGTGLGLAICRELSGVIQGELQIVSQEGHGSMFSLIVPLRLDPTRAAETRLEARFRADLSGRSDRGQG